MSDSDNTIPNVRRRVGSVIGAKYEVVKLLGEGGMGAVYEAVHHVTRRRVAIKVLHAHVAASPDAVARFVQEARAPSTIGHRGIVEVLDAGQEPDGSPFIVLEFLDGHDLAEELSQGPLDPNAVVHIGVELLDVLAAAHARGFVHRDIKPQNVFLGRDTRGDVQVKLLDFGIARQTGIGIATGLTVTGAILGTPQFMSPEQARGDRVDARSDLWSLGATLFRALTGRAPFVGDNYNLMIVSIVTTQPPSLREFRPDVRDALIEAIDRSLRTSLAERWQSAEQMAAALVPLATAEPLQLRVYARPRAGDAALTPTEALSPTLQATPTPVADVAPTETPLAYSHDGDDAVEGPPPRRPSLVVAMSAIATVIVAIGGVMAVRHFGNRHMPVTVTASIALPRPISPSSLATVNTRRPEFRWSLAHGLDAATLELCRDRSCTPVTLRRYVNGTSLLPDVDLEPGVWFWRLRGLVAGQGTARTSATWMFVVRPRDGAARTQQGAIPDVDGDGRADILVGAPHALEHLGQAFVYSTRALSPDARPATALSGIDGANGLFGWSLASAGDVNGDGFGDILVGAPEVFNRSGCAYLFAGSATGLTAAEYTVLGAGDANSYFGASVAGLGDVNGDGYGDVAVGAYGAVDGMGRVTVYHGGPDGLGSSATVAIAAPDGTGSEFGISVARAGDVNGDGFGDLIVGARGVMHETGSAYLFLGSAVGVSPSAAVTLLGADGPGARFGEHVASAGDVNGDGFADVLVSAPRAQDDAGRVYVFHGSASGLRTTPAATLAMAELHGARFGSSLAGGADLNGDGFSDVLVGAPRWSESTGRVFEFHGGAPGLGTTPAVTLDGPDGNGGAFGGTVATIDDFEHDGDVEAIVGADAARNGAGAIYVYRGTRTGLSSATATALTGNGAFDAHFGTSLAGAW